MNRQCVRLTRASMAITQGDSANTTILIPSGAIIELIENFFNGDGLVAALYDDQIIMMLADDIEHHTVKVRVESALR
jgi:hypothetical protein